MTVSRGVIKPETSPYSERVCKRCGKRFKPLSGCAKYCSEECRLGEIECSNCHKMFKRTKYAQKFCCDECRAEYAKKNHVYRKPYERMPNAHIKTYSQYVKNSNAKLIAEREEERRNNGMTYTEMYMNEQ